MDINARLGNAILKAKVDSKINIKYGVQMMEGKTVSLFDSMSIYSQLAISTMLVTLSSYLCLIKLGNHIVTDR